MDDALLVVELHLGSFWAFPLDFLVLGRHGRGLQPQTFHRLFPLAFRTNPLLAYPVAGPLWVNTWTRLPVGRGVVATPVGRSGPNALPARDLERGRRRKLDMFVSWVVGSTDGCPLTNAFTMACSTIGMAWQRKNSESE